MAKTGSKKEEDGSPRDVAQYAKYYRFVPGSESSQGGVIFTPLMGESAAGRVYAVNDPWRAAALDSHDEWESATKKQYDDQTKADARATNKEQDDNEK